MAATVIRNYISDVYLKLGNLSRDDLDLAIVLSIIYDVINEHTIELGMTDSDMLVKYTYRDAGGRTTFPLAIDDFGFLEQVQLEYPDSKVLAVDETSFTEIEKYRIQGLLRCSIYGSPEQIVFTFPVNTDARVKIWYSPDNPQSRGTDQESVIPPIFRALVSSKAAWRLLPMVMHLDPERARMLSVSLSTEVSRLEELWLQYLLDARQQKGSIRRRKFSAGFLSGRYWS